MELLYDRLGLDQSRIRDIEYVLSSLRDGYHVYDFDEYAVGSSSIVYRYCGVIIKIGVDVGSYLRDGSLGDHLVHIKDGHMLSKLSDFLKVPAVYAYDDFVVVMEYVEGVQLADLVGDDYDVVYDRVVDVYMRALSEGYMLRDLNDSNILLCGDQVCVLDFGDVLELSDSERDAYMRIASSNPRDFFELNRYR